MSDVSAAAARTAAPAWAWAWAWAWAASDAAAEGLFPTGAEMAPTAGAARSPSPSREAGREGEGEEGEDDTPPPLPLPHTAEAADAKTDGSAAERLGPMCTCRPRFPPPPPTRCLAGLWLSASPMAARMRSPWHRAWRVSETLWLNRRMHSRHWKGLSPWACVRTCTVSVPFCRKRLPQSGHSKGLSPLCVREWSLRWCFRLNFMPHRSQTKGRSPPSSGELLSERGEPLRTPPSVSVALCWVGERGAHTNDDRDGGAPEEAEEGCLPFASSATRHVTSRCEKLCVT